MGLNVAQVQELVVAPVLQALGLWSAEAERLILGTAAIESGFEAIRQIGGGPALGLWQMEPATYTDIFSNFLAYRPELRQAVLALASDVATPNEMAGNLYFACAMCRVHYLRDPAPLPTDISGMAALWKRHYNTAAGAGSEQIFIAAYTRLVAPIYEDGA